MFLCFAVACQEALLVYQDRHSNNPMPRNDSKVFISIKVCTIDHVTKACTIMWPSFNHVVFFPPPPIAQQVPCSQASAEARSWALSLYAGHWLCWELQLHQSSTPDRMWSQDLSCWRPVSEPADRKAAVSRHGPPLHWWAWLGTQGDSRHQAGWLCGGIHRRSLGHAHVPRTAPAVWGE